MSKRQRKTVMIKINVIVMAVTIEVSTAAAVRKMRMVLSMKQFSQQATRR